MKINFLIIAFIFLIFTVLVLTKCILPDSQVEIQPVDTEESIPTMAATITPDSTFTIQPTPKNDSTPESTATTNPTSTPTVLTPTPSQIENLISTIVINEIGWMGTDASVFDEWLELYNTTNEIIDITGWHLLSNDGMDIILKGAIASHGFYLIERTDDNAIRDINADLLASFGSGGLNNAGERLSLTNALLYQIDSIDATSGWPAGNSASHRSMERINPGLQSNLENWQTNNNSAYWGSDYNGNPILGTPGGHNSVYCISASIQFMSNNII